MRTYPRPTARPRVESLERRDMPSCTFQVKSGTLTVTGDGAGNAIQVEESATQVVAQCDGTSRSYSASTLSRVRIVGGNGDDRAEFLLVAPLTRQRAVTIDLGSGHDSAAVRSAGQAIAVGGTLDATINGKAGNDRIDWEVDAEIDGTARLLAYGDGDHDLLHAFTSPRPGSTGSIRVSLDGSAGDDDLANILVDQSGGTIFPTRSLAGGMGNDHCQGTSGATFQSCEFAEGFVRVVSFGGQLWGVKHGASLGPGPNEFSDSLQNAWVDESGRAHLAITNRDGRWQASELVGLRPLGYGTYTWTIEGDFPNFDVNTVLGLFLYRDDFNEIDFELARWGDPAALNSQFVVQPWAADSMHRFSSGAAGQLTVRLTWNGVSVQARAWAGLDTSLPPLAEWLYAGPKVSKMNLHPRMNFWLMSGLAPENGLPHEVTIRSFAYEP